jgi:predicted amidophosphoribosyltransferase
MKYTPCRPLAEFLGSQLADKIDPDIDMITWLPTANARIRQRGFDHSQRIAKGVARSRQTIQIKLLVRDGDSRQVGSSRNVRLKQLGRSYRVVRQDVIQSARHILLVDDVVSTGGSLEAVALALKHAGARRVSAAVIARNFRG